MPPPFLPLVWFAATQRDWEMVHPALTNVDIGLEDLIPRTGELAVRVGKRSIPISIAFTSGSFHTIIRRCDGEGPEFHIAAYAIGGVSGTIGLTASGVLGKRIANSKRLPRGMHDSALSKTGTKTYTKVATRSNLGEMVAEYSGTYGSRLHIPAKSDPTAEDFEGGFCIVQCSSVGIGVDVTLGTVTFTQSYVPDLREEWIPRGIAMGFFASQGAIDGARIQTRNTHYYVTCTEH